VEIPTPKIEESVYTPLGVFGVDKKETDPSKNYATMGDLQKHYGNFLAKIQQQMSTIGGGGEVNFRGLDDVATSTTGTNKFLTYNPSTRKFYFDFINPATESELGGIKPGAGFTIGVDGTLSLNAGPMFELDELDVFQLKAGTADRIGGIKAGPGVAIDPDGTLFIDSSGVPFTFGDFTGLVGTYSSNTAYALLGSVNTDEDIVIASNGSGAVNVVGEFNVFATNTDVTDALESYQPIFRVLSDGQVRMLVPAADTLTGAFEIVGNTSGFLHPTNQTGVILHTTGNSDSINRVYHDAINNYPIVVGRRYNGTVGALENVKSGETIFRLAGQASTGADFETFGPAKINWITTEDQGPSNQGGKITIDVTANGTAAFGNAITVAEFTANGVISDVGFVGDLTGNADTVTNGVYTTDTGTVTNTMLANSTISGVALGSNLAALTAGTYLTSGGTYNGSTARTFAVDATTTATASKVVARDANGDFAARHISAKIKHTTRNAGSVNGGLTINYNTDDWIVGTFNTDFTITHTNLSAGMSATVVLYNTSGFGNDDITIGIGSEQNTYQTDPINVNDTNLIVLKFYSFGTTTDDLYCEVSYRDVE
jgi:hypothetical protein